MSEPSVLAYSRYFGLATDPAQIDLLQYLPDPVARDDDRDDDNDDKIWTLLSTLVSAADNQVSLASGGPKEVSPRVVAFLAECTEPRLPSQQEFYTILLPQPEQIENLKLSDPILMTGGGDVRKDVRRIRQGVKLNEILDNVVEDYGHCWDSSSALSSSGQRKIQDDLFKFVGNCMEKRIEQDKIPVSHATLNYLQEALQPQYIASTIFELFQKDLPRFEVSMHQLPLDLQEEHFELEPLPDHCMVSPQMQEGPKKVSSPGTFLVQDNGLGRQTGELAKKQSPLNLGQSLESPDLTGERNEVPKSNSVIHEDAILCSSIDWPSSTELTSQSDAQNRHESVTDRNWCEQKHQTEDSNSIVADCSMEVRVPQISATSSHISMDSIEKGLEMMAEHHESQKDDRCDENSDVAQLPLVLPTIEDIMSLCDGWQSAVPTKFFEQPHSSVTSEKLLYRDFEIGLLPNQLAIHELKPDDFEIVGTDEWSVSVADKVFELGASGTHEKCLDSSEVPIQTAESIRLSDDSVDAYAGLSVVQPAVASSEDIQRSSSTLIVENEAIVTEQHDAIDYIVNRKRKQPCISAQIHSPQQNSISTFLDFRGRSAKTSQTIAESNQIRQQDQASVLDESLGLTSQQQDDAPEPNSHRSAGENKVPSPTLPPLQPLKHPKSLIVNSSILRRKPLLLRFLECTGLESLSVNYRELDTKTHPGPDLILNPKTCLFIVSLQSLGQRALPGVKSATCLSPAHDAIASFADQYEQVVILIHNTGVSNSFADTKLSTAMADFAEFGAGLSKKLKTVLLPLWLPTFAPAHVADAVNSWVWQAIRQHGHVTYVADGRQALLDGAILDGTPTMLQVSLMKAGLNAMAAIVVEVELREQMHNGPPSKPQSKSRSSSNFAAMLNQETHNTLMRQIGSKAAQKLENAVMADMM